MFFGDFGCFPTGPNVVPKIRKLVPDWIPTGQKRCPKMQKLVPDGSRLGPEWVPTGSRPGFFKKTLISLNLSTYFWNFSTLPCTTPPPRTPPPTSLKPNTGLAIYMGVSINRDTPTSSIYIGLTIINHPFWGISIYGNRHITKQIHFPWSLEDGKPCASYFRPPL